MALVLAPPSDQSTAVMQVRLEEGDVADTCGLADPVLDGIRQDNPAARSLPFLSALAAGGQQTIRLGLLETQQLTMELGPCRL